MCLHEKGLSDQNVQGIHHNYSLIIIIILYRIRRQQLHWSLPMQQCWMCHVSSVVDHMTSVLYHILCLISTI